MKKRWVKIMAIGCASVFLSMTSLTATKADSIEKVNAGICSAITAYMASNQQASTTANDVATAKAANEAALPVATTEQVAADQTAVVSGYTNLGIADVDTTLNVRSQANESSDVVGKMPKNSGCEILEDDNGWYKIKSGKVEGYVKADYLATGDAANAIASQVVATVATVTTQTLYVREQPNTDCTILALMPQGEELEVLEDAGDWYKVDLDGDAGYVSKDYISVSKELPKAMTMTEIKYGQGVSDVRVNLVNYAEKFIGNRYVWGGTSLTHGADCSGFVLSVYAKYGISLPHHAASQARHGTRISSSEARPGDLFFYGSGKSISHVGIYIGNGQIVHASSPRTGIKISNAFYRSPICVVRLLN